eukprot:2392255-Amphidinium_carterae.1
MMNHWWRSWLARKGVRDGDSFYNQCLDVRCIQPIVLSVWYLIRWLVAHRTNGTPSTMDDNLQIDNRSETPQTQVWRKPRPLVEHRHLKILKRHMIEPNFAYCVHSCPNPDPSSTYYLAAQLRSVTPGKYGKTLTLVSIVGHSDIATVRCPAVGSTHEVMSHPIDICCDL